MEAPLRRAVVGCSSGQHLEQNTPERVQLTAPVDSLLTSHLLWTHVGSCTNSRAYLGQLRPTRHRHGPRDPEIGNDRRASRQEDVLGLDIPMHHVVPVRMAQSGRHFSCYLKRVGHRKLLLAIQPDT
jgi:hypothetical protein